MRARIASRSAGRALQRESDNASLDPLVEAELRRPAGGESSASISHSTP
jgi:hypothetical protein